jgi:hypothetical protein
MTHAENESGSIISLDEPSAPSPLVKTMATVGTGAARKVDADSSMTRIEGARVRARGDKRSESSHPRSDELPAARHQRRRWRRRKRYGRRRRGACGTG